MLMNSNEYLNIVESIKQEIRTAQYRATVSVNRELLVPVSYTHLTLPTSHLV